MVSPIGKMIDALAGWVGSPVPDGLRQAFANANPKLQGTELGAKLDQAIKMR